MFEKYSKEVYQKLQNELANVEEKTMEENDDPIIINAIPKENFDEFIQDSIEVRKHEIQKKMEKLEGKAHDEAMELNEEYNELLEKVREAVKNLRDFEKEKLGSSSEELLEKKN